MYYTYVLQSLKDKKLYIGYSSNLKRRLSQHKSGGSISTKRRLPFRCIFYESFISKEDARRREGYFKTTKGKKALKLMLRVSLLSHEPD
jgi:putative endonuclease